MAEAEADDLTALREEEAGEADEVERYAGTEDIVGYTIMGLGL